MKHMRNGLDGERWVEALDRELKSLPDHQAPPTLIPSVLAAIEARSARPWYKQSWVSWPVGVRLVVTAVSLLVIAASAWSWADIVSNLGVFGSVEETISDFVYIAGAVMNLAYLVVNAVITGLARTYSPFLLGIAIVLIAMYLACIGCGTLLYRLARIPGMKGTVR